MSSSLNKTTPTELFHNEDNLTEPPFLQTMSKEQLYCEDGVCINTKRLRRKSLTRKVHAKTCLIINTGGTFSMEPTEKGLSPSKTPLAEKLKEYTAFYDPAFNSAVGEDYIGTPIFDRRRLVYKVVEFEKKIDSCNIGINDYKAIVRVIEKNYNSFDSFLIIHGTDTLEYTASILGFMITNLKKTIILTAS